MSNKPVRNILVVDPLCKKYGKFPHVDGSTVHRVPALTLDALPREHLGGLLFNKLTIYADAEIEQIALTWVLSMLRDVKDEPSGIGN